MAEGSTYSVGNVGAGAQVVQGEKIKVKNRTYVLPPRTATPAARSQLGPDIGDFTDREVQLDRMRAMAAPTLDGVAAATQVVAVAGPPGVGKSALVLHLAHELAARFPDGQLYVNLRGPDREPLSAQTALAGFLRALEVADDALPATMAEREALYRSLLAAQRVLVVLDNASREDQVRPLIPGGAGCLVLVTSRAALAGLDAAVLLQLKVLDPSDSVELIRRVAGAERLDADQDAAEVLAGLCGYLPLALRIAGARLRTKSHWSVAKLVEMLADERGRLAELKAGDQEVRAAFTLSYGQLADPEARMFRLLALLGPDFTAEIAATLMDVDPEVGEELLEQLVDAQLLEVVDEGRYRFHDLLRLFAGERLEAEERANKRVQALQRALDWYVEQASAANAALDPSSALTDRLKVALNWFESERLALVAAVGRASDARLWALVLRLTEKLIRFFDVRSYWADWERLAILAVAAARASGDRQGEAQTLNNLGMARAKQGRWEEAIACHEQSLAICRQLGDRHGEAQTFNNLGLALDKQGRWEEAVVCYEQSLVIKRQLGSDRHGEGNTLNNLGMARDKQGRFEEAIVCYEQSLIIKRQLGDRHGEAQTLNNLGLVRDKQRRFEEAIVCYEQSLAIKRQLGDRHGEGNTLNNLGMAYDKQGRWEEAIACYEQDLTICRQLRDRHGEALTLGNLGNVYLSQGRWEEAIACYEQSLAIRRQFRDRHGEGQTLGNLGIVRANQGRWEEAIACFEQSLAIFRQMGDRHGEAQTLNNLGLARDKQGH